MVCLGLAGADAEVPANLVVEGVPEISGDLRRDVMRYQEFRSGRFAGWHPLRREMLIQTRFADTVQVHHVREPGGVRRQLTFFAEPVGGVAVQPGEGRFMVLSRDSGGAEAYQLYRYDLNDGKVAPLTREGRNTGVRFSRSGRWMAYASTRRNGRDTDIYRMDPGTPGSDQLLLSREGGGWSVADWSGDDELLLLSEYVSINESYVHLFEIKTGVVRPVTSRGGVKAAYSNGRLSPDGQFVYVATDEGSEHRRLVKIDVRSGEHTPLTPAIQHDVEAFELSPNGKSVAYVVNVDGTSMLQVAETRRGRTAPAPELPAGVISGLEWHSNGRDIGFTFSSAASSSDAYSVDSRSGQVTRWTESETGGLDPSGFVEPETVKIESFDGVEVSALVYRPDPGRFPGKRPVLLRIHGGPESQARPGFLGAYNYFLDWLGVAVVVPNVRGSRGYGKTYLQLDNGYKREDSVRDIGAIIEWIGSQPGFNSDRIAVVGGSYGGYMVLASMVEFSDRLRCGVDVVGISNFVTFLEHTKDYRRDLRRAEYGDERDEAMRAFLERISPANRAERIKKPLLVVQGQNDPRVPWGESEQMVKAIREQGGTVWYVMAKDEGHGFRKKPNADYQFMAMVRFFYEFLLR